MQGYRTEMGQVKPNKTHIKPQRGHDAVQQLGTEKHSDPVRRLVTVALAFNVFTFFNCPKLKRKVLLPQNFSNDVVKKFKILNFL